MQSNYLSGVDSIFKYHRLSIDQLRLIWFFIIYLIRNKLIYFHIDLILARVCVVTVTNFCESQKQKKDCVYFIYLSRLPHNLFYFQNNSTDKLSTQ